MRPGPAATVGLLLLLAITVSACGDEGTVTVGDKTQPTLRVTAPAGANTRPSPEARRCRRSLGEFLDSIESLANTLAVGLGYEDYLASVNRVRSTYAGVPSRSLSPPCLALAAGPAESALNLYIAAANAWGDCLATASCDVESIEPKLQRKWEAAGNLITSAQSGLRHLG